MTSSLPTEMPIYVPGHRLPDKQKKLAEAEYPPAVYSPLADEVSRMEHAAGGSAALPAIAATALGLGLLPSAAWMYGSATSPRGRVLHGAASAKNRLMTTGTGAALGGIGGGVLGALLTRAPMLSTNTGTAATLAGAALGGYGGYQWGKATHPGPVELGLGDKDTEPARKAAQQKLAGLLTRQLAIPTAYRALLGKGQPDPRVVQTHEPTWLGRMVGKPQPSDLVNKALNSVDAIDRSGAYGGAMDNHDSSMLLAMQLAIAHPEYFRPLNIDTATADSADPADSAATLARQNGQEPPKPTHEPPQKAALDLASLQQMANQHVVQPVTNAVKNFSYDKHIVEPLAQQLPTVTTDNPNNAWWRLPAAVGAGGLGLGIGYGAVNSGLKALKKRDNQAQLAAAEKEYQDAMEAQYRQLLHSKTSSIAQLYDLKKTGSWTANDMLQGAGGYYGGMAALLAALFGAQGYRAGRQTGEAALTDKALQLRALSRPAPQPPLAVPVTLDEQIPSHEKKLQQESLL